MKIAFFGVFGSFDYFKIGGVESFSRRLATGLIREGHGADFVVYGAQASRDLVAGPGIGLHYRAKLKEAFEILAQAYDHVLTIYLRPQDRLQYLRFRRLHRHRPCFHQVYTSWPDSTLKRQAMILDALLYPFSGRLFCISQRIFHHVSRWSKNSFLMLPPVPESFFLEPDAKPKHDKIKVTYIGRTEPDKGIEDVIFLFSRLKDHPEVEVQINGFHHRHLETSVRIHEWLSLQHGIRYFYTPFECYSPEVDEKLRQILRETDILVLPYRRLSSTMDTPLLLLEGMASLCAIITRAFGDIPSIYGPSSFLLSGSEEIYHTIPFILKAKKFLETERNRIRQNFHRLRFGVDQTVSRLIDALAN